MCRLALSVSNNQCCGFFCCHFIVTFSHCCSNNKYNVTGNRPNIRMTGSKKNRKRRKDGTNGAIVDVVREVTLCGPRRADSRPDLSTLHTAQPLSRCNYLSHCERVCICMCFRGEGVVELHLTRHANQPLVSHK